MKTSRSGYFIVDTDTKELRGPNQGISYKTRQAAQAALDSWAGVDGYVQLFRFTAIKEPERKPHNEHTGYFSRNR